MLGLDRCSDCSSLPSFLPQRLIEKGERPECDECSGPSHPQIDPETDEEEIYHLLPEEEEDPREGEEEAGSSADSSEDSEGSFSDDELVEMEVDYSAGADGFYAVPLFFSFFWV